MRRAEVIPALDPGCTSKRNDYSSMANYERFLKGQLMGYINEISGLTGQAMINKKNSNNIMQNNEYTFYLDKLYEQTALRLTWDDLWRKREIEVEGSWLHELYQVKTRRRLRLQRFRVFGLHQAMR